jgi:hypothetical protein
MVRYAQLGMKEQLVSSKELWLCYFCGECTTTCPRQADPGEFMAAARRYAIGRYDRLGLAKRLYTSTLFNLIFLFGLAILLGVFIYTFHGPMPGDELRLFDFIPAHVIHDGGVIGGILVILLILAGMINMAIQIWEAAHFSKGARFNWIEALWQSIGVEAIGQLRFRKDCETYAGEQPWYIQKWFIHASMLWGFIGLFIATGLDFFLDWVGVKPTGAWVPIWYPSRLLGTLAGALLLYGVTAVIVKRLWKVDTASAHSAPSDWSFLALLWLSGITGFALEISIYLPHPQAWSYWMLLAHLIVVVELLILAPFTKFAHAFYRIAALYVYALKPVTESETVIPEAAD